MPFRMGLQKTGQLAQGYKGAVCQLIAGAVEQDVMCYVIDLLGRFLLYLFHYRTAVVFSSACAVRAFVLFVIDAIPVSVRYGAAVVAAYACLVGAFIFFIIDA